LVQIIWRDCAIERWFIFPPRHSMASSVTNICTKNYWNSTITVKLIIGGWVVNFFETCVHVMVIEHCNVWLWCALSLSCRMITNKDCISSLIWHHLMVLYLFRMYFIFKTYYVQYSILWYVLCMLEQLLYRAWFKKNYTIYKL